MITRENLEYIDDLPLSVYEFRLLYHYYCVNNCNESLRELAKICKMSTSKAHGAKRKLARAGLLKQWGVTADPRDGYIYLLKSDNGFYKIGQSVEPKRRARGINSASPVKVTILHHFPADDMNLAERELHCKFAEFRQRGEWFNLPEGAVKYLLSLNGFEDGSFFSRIKPK